MRFSAYTLFSRGEYVYIIGRAAVNEAWAELLKIFVKTLFFGKLIPISLDFLDFGQNPE